MRNAKPPDLFAAGIRFLCGALFGTVLGFWAVLTVQRLDVFIAGIVAGGLICGFLSA